MALQKYNVTVNNMATVLQLDEAGAKRYGLTSKDVVGARKVEPKQEPKQEQEQEQEPAAPKAATPANKSRTAANK